jgi:uncharacterized protein
MINNSMNPGDPVTVIVKHRVIPGKEQEYEEWARGITEAARKFDGYLGVNYIRPSDSSKAEHVLIFKFNSYATMMSWEESEERAKWKEKRRNITIDEPRIQRVKGWDYWFTLPAAAMLPPARYKMLIITVFSLYPLSLYVPRLLKPVIGGFPLAFQVFVNSAVIVPLMMFLVMPAMIRIFSFWLYPSKPNY